MFLSPSFLQDCEECIRLDPNFSESKSNHNQAVGVNSIGALGYRKGKQGGGGGKKRQLQNWGGGQGGREWGARTIVVLCTTVGF